MVVMYDAFSALIFDMDGTIVDSGQMHEVAWIDALTRFGIPIDRPLMRSMTGMPTLATVQVLFDRFGQPSGVFAEDIRAYKDALVDKNFRTYVKPTPLVEVVKHYYGKKPMAVGTGARTTEALEVLEICGLLSYFDAVVGIDQVDAPKPAPDTFLRCAQLMHVEPQHCVVFEDALLGMEAARIAKMAVVDVEKDLKQINDYFL